MTGACAASVNDTSASLSDHRVQGRLLTRHSMTRHSMTRHSMRHRRLLLVGLVFLLLGVALLAGAGIYWWNLREPVPPTEIYEGVTYGCERLETDDEGSGLWHWVRVGLERTRHRTLCHTVRFRCSGERMGISARAHRDGGESGATRGWDECRLLYIRLGLGTDGGRFRPISRSDDRQSRREQASQGHLLVMLRRPSRFVL